MAEHQRTSLSKRLRFSVFSRDNFTCRYCGRQSDRTVLVVDHVIPVCRGGTADESNLVTSCEDCNSGKGGRSPDQAAPTESDRLRIAQEKSEQLRAAESAQMAVVASRLLRQAIIDLWCDIRETETVDRGTINVMVCYAEKHGTALLTHWIRRAHARKPHASDTAVGRYVSGIRRLWNKREDETLPSPEKS